MKINFDTPSDLIGELEAMSIAEGKIFIPDSLDEKIAANCLKFVESRGGDGAMILDTIEKYLSLNQGMTTSMRHMAERFPELFLIIKDGREQKERIYKLMQTTKERMQETEL